MKRLNFTTKVLGVQAAERLRRKEVTQTLRSATSDIVAAYLHGKTYLEKKITPGDLMEVALDDRLVGQAYLIRIETVDLDHLTIDDAHRGGFDSISALALALKRAGYRFKPIESYTFYRVQFSWDIR